MSSIGTKQTIRQSTIDVLEAISGLDNYTIHDAPVGSLELESAPFISVFLQAESGTATSKFEPGFITGFELVLQLVYKAGASDTMEKKWADEVERAECLIQEGLFQNDTWLKQFTDVPGYRIEREQVSEAESLFIKSLITIEVELYIPYKVNR